jgi:hypothetical protein
VVGVTGDHPDRSSPEREVALVDLLDRLLASGAVLTGDITLAIADVDLVHISLRALITSISAGQPVPDLALPSARARALPGGRP